jgi:hypothetical protein
MLATVKAQGGTFGWVSDSAALLTAVAKDPKEV